MFEEKLLEKLEVRDNDHIINNLRYRGSEHWALLTIVGTLVIMFIMYSYNSRLCSLEVCRLMDVYR